MLDNVVLGGNRFVCKFGKTTQHVERGRKGKGSRDVVARDVVLGGNHPCHCFFLLIRTAVRNFDNVFKKRE